MGRWRCVLRVLTCPALAAGHRTSSGFLGVWPRAAPHWRAASAAWRGCDGRATQISCRRPRHNINNKDLTSSSGSSSAAPRPTSAGLVHIQRLSTLTKPGRQLCLTAKRLPGPLGNNRIPRSSLSSRKWIHLGEEDSVALGPRPKSKNQTLF